MTPDEWEDHVESVYQRLEESEPHVHGYTKQWVCAKLDEFAIHLEKQLTLLVQHATPPPREAPDDDAT